MASWAGKVTPANHNAIYKVIKSGANDTRDQVSISKYAEKAFRKQDFIDSLLKQKQNIIDSKNSLIGKTLENGQDLNIIKDKLEKYDEQINAIDKQITDYMFKEQQGKTGMNAKENTTADKQPKTEEEIQNDHLKNIVALSSDISQVQTVSPIKREMQGQARILEREIKLDESRSHSGQKATYKREQLAKINERITEVDQKIGQALNDAAEKLKDQTRHEKEAIPDKSKEASNEQASQLSKYKDSSKDSMDKSQLEILA